MVCMLIGGLVPNPNDKGREGSKLAGFFFTLYLTKTRNAENSL